MQSVMAVGVKVGSLVGILGILSLLFGCGSKDKAPTHEFSVTDGVVRYRDATIEGADPESFQPLDDHYAKDARQVYYASTYRVSQDYFTTKRARVRVVEGADGASFFRLLRDGYARDAQRVYFEGAPIEVEDVDTFELLDYGFARDRGRGYYMEEPVPGSDGTTFVVLDSHYAKDAQHLFHCDLEPGVDGSPPRRVMVQLPAAEPASFLPLDSGYAKDADHAYYRGRVIALDPDSFSVLYFDYAKSSSRVFYRGEVVEGADAATFAVVEQPSGDFDAQDASATYSLGKRMPR
jgi:hypothetical protein